MKELPTIVFVFLRIVMWILAPFQLIALLGSYSLCHYLQRLGLVSSAHRRIVVGVTETARMIHFLGAVLPSCYTVVLDRNRFYQDPYDFGPIHILLRPVLGPLLLGYLATRADAFMYISFSGFCADRRLDFWFLRRINRKIVTLFCGSDIRSLKLSKEFFAARDEDSYANYLPNADSIVYDNWVKKVARDADDYSDLILNWRYDQIGYITRETYPWPYIIDLETVPYSFALPTIDQAFIIVHAPSSPMTKGTQLVRAAIKKIKEQGFKLEYIELIGVPNSEILAVLQRSHIVLQEFYFLTPGVFGLEALASGNAMLCAASLELNPELPQDAKFAWYPTRYWQVYDHLHDLLSNPGKIQSLAQSGRQFVERHYALQKARKEYTRLLTEHGIAVD